MVVERCHLQVWGGGSAIVFFSFSFQLLIKLAFNYFFKQIYSTINSLNRKPNQPLLCNREQNLKQMRQMPSATATSQIEKRSVLFKRPKIVSTVRQCTWMRQIRLKRIWMRRMPFVPFALAEMGGKCTAPHWGIPPPPLTAITTTSLPQTIFSPTKLAKLHSSPSLWFFRLCWGWTNWF